MRKNTRLGLYIIAVATMFAACKKSDPATVVPVIPPVVDTTSTPIPSPAKETFESGNKAEYASSSITLSTGKWNFTDAVVGNSTDDSKNGAKSARIQQNGRIGMNFDIVGGVFRVVISSGTYGTDGPSSWQLWASTNSGYSYSQMGSTITTSSPVLKTDTIVISAVGKVRLSIRKVSGAANRLNIDDIEAILTSGPLAPDFSDNNNMLMGNPSNATQSVLDFSNYYMNKIYYSVSYNSELGKPNWVSWHLNAADQGSTPRQDDFREDDALPSTWYHVTNLSYTGSGFDRGHSCPSNDRTSSVEANSSTFLMTNMIPQAPNNNQGPWAKLEDSCNRLVTTQGKELYIICGSYGVGGVGNNGFLNDIDNSKVSVPAYTWKIVVVMTNSNNDLSRVDNNTRVIAVVIPNDNSVGITTSWKSFRVNVDAIETATGYNLLSNVPEAVQAVIESRTDNL